MVQGKSNFNGRAFAALGILFSLVGLAISGIMNHFLAFDGMTVERHAWMSAHNVLSVLFIAFACTHIVLNWRPLVKHFQGAATRVISKEAVLAFLLIVCVSALVVSHAFIAGR